MAPRAYTEEELRNISRSISGPYTLQMALMMLLLRRNIIDLDDLANEILATEALLKAKP